MKGIISTVKEHELGQKSNETVWLNSQELADHLKVSLSEIYNLTSDGYIPYYKLGRRNRYLKKEIDDFLMSKRMGGLQ